MKSDRVFVSLHAYERFAERFPGEDFHDSFDRAVATDWVTLARDCKAAKRPGTNYRSHYQYLRDERSGAVFACNYNSGTLEVVTILEIPVPKTSRGEVASC